MVNYFTTVDIDFTIMVNCFTVVDIYRQSLVKKPTRKIFQVIILSLYDVSYILQYHRNIEINITDNHHFAFVYLLGKLDYSLYGQQNKNLLFIYKN